MHHGYVYYLDLDVELESEITENETSAEALENSTEPGLKIINAHKLWEMGITGKGRIMMNIDTGVDGDHPALSGTWRGNSALASEAWLDHSSNPSTTPSDCGTHGTHVMGIMGGLNTSNRPKTLLELLLRQNGLPPKAFVEVVEQEFQDILLHLNGQ